MLKSILYPKLLLTLSFFWLILPATSEAAPKRFFIMGDGTLVLAGQSIQFRDPEGNYLEGGLKKINQIFRAPWSQPQERINLRFIEVLDYVQDQLQGKSYRLRSGYRSPGNNQALRNRGKLAAQSSMHVEGAAGDLILTGVPSSQVFDFVKALNCCGIGWYHSRHFHLDTGPSRFWDEKTSKTEDKRPQQNEKVILQPDYDRYRSGEVVGLKWMRITEFPIGVPAQYILVTRTDPPQEIAPLKVQYSLAGQDPHACIVLNNREAARAVQVTLPSKNLVPGPYALKVAFCNRYHYEKMPETVLSRPFEVMK